MPPQKPASGESIPTATSSAPDSHVSPVHHGPVGVVAGAAAGGLHGSVVDGPFSRLAADQGSAADGDQHGLVAADPNHDEEGAQSETEVELGSAYGPLYEDLLGMQGSERLSQWLPGSVEAYCGENARVVDAIKDAVWKIAESQALHRKRDQITVLTVPWVDGFPVQVSSDFPNSSLVRKRPPSEASAAELVVHDSDARSAARKEARVHCITMLYSRAEIPLKGMTELPVTNKARPNVSLRVIPRGDSWELHAVRVETSRNPGHVIKDRFGRHWTLAIATDFALLQNPSEEESPEIPQRQVSQGKFLKQVARLSSQSIQFVRID